MRSSLLANAVPLPDEVSLSRAHALASLESRRTAVCTSLVRLLAVPVLVHGAAVAVGVCAVHLARRAGAVVIATVRTAADESIARNAGADHVFRLGPESIESVHAVAPHGVDHIVEVAFGANITIDMEPLAFRDSVATYASDADSPNIPFWPLLFKNVRVDFLGSDDFTLVDKAEAARAITEALVAGWRGSRWSSNFRLKRSLPPTSDSKLRARAAGWLCRSKPTERKRPALEFVVQRRFRSTFSRGHRL